MKQWKVLEGRKEPCRAPVSTTGIERGLEPGISKEICLTGEEQTPIY